MIDAIIEAAVAANQQAMARVEAQVVADHQGLLGHTVGVIAVSGYVGNDSVDIDLSPPAKVRIDATPVGSLKRWIDDWCDPVYDVTLVEDHPQLKGVRSLWVYGTSRHIDGQSVEPSDLA